MGCGASIIEKPPSSGKGTDDCNEKVEPVNKVEKRETTDTAISKSATSDVRPPGLVHIENLDEFVRECIATGGLVDAVKRFLHNQNAHDAFMEYLKYEHAEENGEFFSELEVAIKNSDDIDKKAYNLVDKYVKPGSKSEINVSDMTRKNILQLTSHVTDDDHNKEELLDAFKKAQNEIILILAMDALPRYIKSDFFKKWREKEIQNGYAAVDLLHEVEQQQQSSHKITTTILSESSKLDPNRNQSSSFLQRAFAALDPVEVPRIMKSHYLSTFLASVEGLPISVSLSSASSNRRGFPLIYVNAVFEEISGYRRYDIIGRNCRFLQCGKADIESKKLLSEALREAKPIKIELINYRANGDEFRNLLAMKPIFNYQGKYAFVIGLQFDLTNKNSTIPKLQFIDHLLSMLPDRLPKTDNYDPLAC